MFILSIMQIVIGSLAVIFNIVAFIFNGYDGWNDDKPTLLIGYGVWCGVPVSDVINKLRFILIDTTFKYFSNNSYQVSNPSTLYKYIECIKYFLHVLQTLIHYT